MDQQRRSNSGQYYNNDNSGGAIPGRQGDIVEWLNEASITSDSALKCEQLNKIKEVIIHQQPQNLNIYLDSILAFQNDRNIEVRKFVVGFIEDAIRKNVELVPNVIVNMQVLLQDKAAQVQKRAIQTATHMYRLFLTHMAKAPSLTEQMQVVWNIITSIKAYIINMVDSENDGLRTQIVKFLESIVLLQTYLDPESIKRTNDFSLDDVPLTLKVARRRKLEEEALTVFDLMLKFHGSAHISSANLMACMGSLTTIAKLRPQFMGKVIDALESLHLNLPPTLSTSQVSSVRKHLKMQLLVILKHPAAYNYHTNITTLLTDLGATNAEVMKMMPKGEDFKKRTKRPLSETTDNLWSTNKKQRIGEIQLSESAVDITESFVLERLTPDVTADMVLTFMASLPNSMPPVFSATYTPIAAAGTQGQIKHVARLLASQLTLAGLGPGTSLANQPRPLLTRGHFSDDEGGDEDEDDDMQGNKTSASILIGDKTELESSQDITPSGFPKAVKLSDMARPLPPSLRDSLEIEAVQRVLSAETCSLKAGVDQIRHKLIATLAASFSYRARETILEWIKCDLRNQIGLALCWLYEEYSLLQGFSKRPPNQLQDGVNCDNNYSNLLSTLIITVINNKDIKERQMILNRLYLEVPLLTNEALDLLKEMCWDEPVGLNIVNQLITLRPPKQLTFLNLLLVNTSHQKLEIREGAIGHVCKLYEREELKSIIEEFAVLYLNFLRLPQPPDILFGMDKGRVRTAAQPTWNDDSIRSCLYLYMALLPCNQTLIYQLGEVYVETMAEVKRVILRIIDQPVRVMGMHSPHLLRLVEDCPKGAETLVTRIIHILTDKCVPSEELVQRVRDLYKTRVSDVRFLIPVLTGLTKDEILTALPKLIKLNPVVVKEVFSRLVGNQLDGSVTSPVSPSELLIALHTIDPTLCELKTVIKSTAICFSDKETFTQEVLAVVMQQLMEMSPLPTLLMRTVIQALSLYPRLIGFIMNILQRLILKQVWKQKKVWEGFIKCCQRTQPHSFQVLLQLPAQQLTDVFIQSPDLKQPLLDHIMTFTDNQRAHIPQNIMDILVGSNQSIHMDFKIKEEPMSPPDLTIDVKEEYEEPPKMFVEPAPPGLD